MSRNMRLNFAKAATWSLALLVLILMWIVHPLVAHAQGVGSDSGSAVVVDTSAGPVSDALTMILKVVFSALGIIGTWLTTKAITYFQTKTKIEIPAATEQLLFNWADQAVGLAAEKAHQVLQATGKALDGNAKLNIATQFILDLVKKHDLDEVAEEKVKNYIEAKLGIKRLDTVGVGTAPAPATETVVVAK